MSRGFVRWAMARGRMLADGLDYLLLDLAAWAFGKLKSDAGLSLIENILAEELKRKPVSHLQLC